ncbi:polyhydroxyalkanoate synthesis protein PhaF [Kribbella sp. NPDC003505]|uniref:polyhydroxyalkanoate synthesis protein PhaF n=1 Tax=Kribbella sp. NPDC003505 TaxID=3154448 RepID=UPI0033B50438
MVLDALRGYVQLASGLTEVTKQKAQTAAKALLQQTGADALTSRASELADEIVATSKSNRQLLQAIVANEVEGAVARLGFVRSEEVAALTRRVKALETELAEAHAAASERAAAEKSTPAAEKSTGNSAPAKPAGKKPAKKAAAKKTAKKA